MTQIVSFPNTQEAFVPTATGLEALQLLVRADLIAVNQLIVQRMQSPVALIPQLAGHIVAAGGKRLRPVLTLAAAALCGYQGLRHHKLAACVEFIHTATLLHDDVVDESLLRRGEASANALFGNSASVLVGDFLFSRAFELMVEDGSLDVLRILSRASAVIAEGEVLQITTTRFSGTTEMAYLDVVRAKTAELFAAACRIGALVAGRPAAEEAALQSYGLNLGIAFQIIDDVLDYSAKQAALGKNVGDDFREGKMTLPLIIALARAQGEEQEFLRQAVEKLDQPPGALARTMEILQRHGALRDAAARAQHYAAVAKDALGIFADSPIKQALLEAVDFTLQREF